MGYECHHAIIVTGSLCDADFERAHTMAISIFPVVSGLYPSMTNFYWSFFIPPDGSKEGWVDSVEGDKKRDEFVKFLEKQALTFVEVQYGDDAGDDRVVSGNGRVDGGD